MGIIIKFILKNTWEKKFRTILIIFSVILSSALFFASNAISDTMVKMYLDRMAKYYGSSEIVVEPSSKSPQPFFSDVPARKYLKEFEYMVGSVQSSCSYKPSIDETINITLQGNDLADLEIMNPIVLEKQSNLHPFGDKKMIISKKTADSYGIGIGDIMELNLNGSVCKFRVCGIAAPVGPFIEDAFTTYAIVPRSTLSSLAAGSRGSINSLYIKLKDNTAGIDPMIEKLKKEYPDYNVRRPISEEDIKRQTQQMSTPFLLTTVIVMLMSVFIIYTSFKVVTMERLPLIGTFRSIGATRKMTNMVLFAESLIYGIAGGGLGCILGLGVLYIMAMMSPYSVWMEGVGTTIRFSTGQMAAAFIMAVVLCLASSIIPIRKVSKIPLKDIVLNSIETKKKSRTLRPVLGVLLFMLSIIIPRISPRSAAMGLDTASIVLCIMSVVMLIPYITKYIIILLEKVYGLFFGNICVLAVKNLKENKNIQTSISLLVIGISTLLTINSVSYSVLTEITNYFVNTSRYDIEMNIPMSDRNTEQLIRKTDGVADVCGVYQRHQVALEGYNGQILGLQGVDSSKYPDYYNMDLEDSDESVLRELDLGRNIIVGLTLKNRYNLQKGSILKLKFDEKVYQYKVIGFLNTISYNGSFALVSQKYLKADTKSKYYDYFAIKTYKPADQVKDSLKKQFVLRMPYVMTMSEISDSNMKSNSQMFSVMKGFSIMALVIGILGILNNLIISFIQRKRSIAMMKSVGMNRRQVFSMIFIESLTGGIVGGALGIITGLLMISTVPYIMEAMDMAIPISYTMELLVSCFIAGVSIMVIASLSPAFKSSKLNIIESIKYE